MGSYLADLPPDFEPTAEEKSLLDLYATVKSYEREAAKLREAAAKAKLAAADERYQRYLEKKNSSSEVAEGDDRPEGKKRKGRKAKRSAKAKSAAAAGSDENDGEGISDEASDMSDGSDEEDLSGDEARASLAQRREEKLRKMREDLEEKKRMAVEEEEAAEALRLRHLNEADAADVTDLPALKKKKLENTDKPAPSLISNLQGQATPPHEFSKKLNMGKANLSGTILFPTNKEGAPVSWTPPLTATQPTDGALEIQLSDFDWSQAQSGFGNNTLAVKFTAPEESKRFSLNIAGPGHRDYYDVLFHFNPRHHQKGGQLLINDKQEGIWGSAVEVPLSTLPLIFGEQSRTLIVQINGDGFDVFIEGQHCARLEHRTQFPKDKCSLTLQFPSTDDYGSPENWTVYRVWWGQKPIMATGDISGVAGVNIYSALHPRKLFISGLSRISTEPEVDLRRAEFERAFRKYGGVHGVSVVVPTNSTFAFVEVETERQADLALQEMASKYRLNRARRTKHEALQEERAAAEAANEGKVKESSEWD